MSITDRLSAIKANIAKLQKESPLAAKHVKLIAVSKAQSIEAITELLEAGQRVFGENRVQEAAEKWPNLREKYPDIELHLIGSLQTNKVREALELFDVIEAVDRVGLVDAIVKESSKLNAIRCKKFFIQVNIGNEPQKGGISIEALPHLLAACNLQPATLVSGLMCVPPADQLPAPYFALLYKLAKEHSLPNLSMGMSGDYETATRLGATHVRIGTALFGERK